MKTKIHVKELMDLSVHLLQDCGASDDDINIIIDHLLDGEFSGHSSHGFYRLPSIISTLRGLSPSTEIAFEQETSNSVLLKGGGRLGLVVALSATHALINKMQQANIVICGGYDYVGTTGSMGYYTRKLAENGMLSIMVANSISSIPAWGGLQPIFGTNPISIGIPSNDDPIVIDFATSKWSYGDIALAIKEGRRIPEGIVLDEEGNPSTDPNDADYIMLPFGEHKGYALALAIEILAGPLVKAKAGESIKGSDGFMIIGINPNIFGSSDKFRDDVSILINEIKSSKKMNGVNEIFYPGERSHRKRKLSRNFEYIEILSSILDDIKALAIKD